MRSGSAIISLLGAPAARAFSRGDVDAAIAAVSPRTFRSFKGFFQLDKKRMSDVLSVGERTVDRMLEPGYRVPADLADRLLRIARVLDEAEDALEDRQRALDWLKSGVPALGWRVPLDLLRTDLGTRLVSDEIARIKFGIPS